MENLGGLSTDLKEKIAATKVVVIGKDAYSTVAGNKVKTYPKFYLSTIANDVN